MSRIENNVLNSRNPQILKENQQFEKKPTLLVISKDLEFTVFLKKYLANNFSLIIYHQERDIEEQLLLSRPDCIILNLDQASSNIIEKLTQIQEWSELHFIPIIAIVNRFEQQNRANYLSIADMVFYHPVNSLELVASMTKHINKRKHFLRNSLIDSITGVYNSYFLIAELQKQFSDMQRTFEPLSLAYLELETGLVGAIEENELLKVFAGFIKNSIRPSDFLGHYQGTRGLILILPQTIKSDARKLIGRLKKQLTIEKVKTSFSSHNETVAFSTKIVEVTDTTRSPEEWLSLTSFSNNGQKEKTIGELDELDEENPIALKKVRLAIIDDDRLIRELLKRQLQGIGEEDYDVDIRSYANGEEFFNDPWHRQNERFLLIIDRVMPKMDGLEILRKIRTEYDRKRYLCFILTSKGSETDIALAIKKGANDYMTKPFSLKELQERIKRLLRGTR